MTKWTTAKEYLGLSRAKDRPGRTSWLPLLFLGVSMVAADFFMHRYDVPFWWQVLIFGSVALVVCPALILLAMAVIDRRPS